VAAVVIPATLLAVAQAPVLDEAPAEKIFRIAK
jgi:hypothetical protein